MFKWSKIFAYAIILIALLALTVVSMTWYRTIHDPLPVPQGGTSVKVFPGHGIIDLTNSLTQKKLLAHPRFFIMTARVNGAALKLRYGEYAVTPGMSAYDLLSNIVSGKGLVKHQITFIEGWTFKQVRAALEADDALDNTLQGKSDQEVMAALDMSGKHPEGLFFPDTYTFYWRNKDTDILRRAYDRMQQILRQQWQQRATDAPWKSPYEALIVASLIEKETRVAKERPIVAGVIINRLKKRMRLQIDPTVLYGLGKAYSEPITRRDLRTPSAYNTYTMYGLPPTPIDTPSLASIKAALHPQQTDYLYYVSNGDGSHRFSKNYRGHLRAVRAYRIVQQQKEITREAPMHLQPRYLWRSPLMDYASFIMCFMCI